MQLSRSKTSVASWLLFAFCSLVASAISLNAGVFQLTYAVPALAICLTLYWTRTDPHYYRQTFYRRAWHLNLLLLSLLALVILAWHFGWPAVTPLAQPLTD
jgi:hypothetical protein